MLQLEKQNQDKPEQKSRKKFVCGQRTACLAFRRKIIRRIPTMNSSPLSIDELSALVAGLHRLAHNLWWTWNQGAQEIFQELSPRSWQNLYHNAVAVLHEVSDYELRARRN